MQVMAGTKNVTHSSVRLSSLNIKALLTFNSVVGRAAKPASLDSIEDVNLSFGGCSSSVCMVMPICLHMN